VRLLAERLGREATALAEARVRANGVAAKEAAMSERVQRLTAELLELGEKCERVKVGMGGVI
jgi:hypothetical protein